MQLVEDRHHVCRPVMVVVYGYRIGLANVERGPVRYVDIAPGICREQSILSAVSTGLGYRDRGGVLTCTQAEPVMQSMECVFSAGEHVLVQVRTVLEERVLLSGDCIHSRVMLVDSHSDSQ